jgi:CheY-like chemotaxis protein
VGEIRDLETAEIAFHAAMTGHLVLSTLHTNSTCATVARLLDLGVDAFLIGASTNVIIAQRLLRTICPKCKQVYTPPGGQLERLHLGSAEFKFYRGVGCENCGKTGYSGRAGVYELLRITPSLKELITRKAGEPELRKAALNAGMVPLLDAALQKVKDGITTVDEVLRVIQLQEEEVARCPKCASLIDLQFANCPYCMHPLKRICEACRQQLKPEWLMCPYCSTPVSRPQQPAAPERVAAVAVAAAATPQPAAVAGRQPYIMVVDDDEVMRSVIASAINILPAQPEVVEASDGFQALARIEERKPDMLVLDVNMPGMTGFELCQKLRQKMETAFVPILMLTASVDEASRSKGFLVGTDDYMGKPFAIPELHARVTRLLRRTYGF